MVVRAADVDIGSMFGYSFPRYRFLLSPLQQPFLVRLTVIVSRGGILKWADTMPSEYIHGRLEAWDKEFGPQIRSRFFMPSNYLAQRAGKRTKLVRTRNRL